MKKPAKTQNPAAAHHAHVIAVQHQLNRARHQSARQLLAAHQKQIQSLKHQLHVARRAPVGKGGKKVAKKRGWSPDSDVALCTARAFAETLRIASRAVSDSAVLDVYWATAADADAGASIEATYAAILAGGLGGCYLADGPVQGLVLGLALPEPHAVAAAPDGRWWSWGEPYAPADFPGAVIEEAWAVTWQR